MSLLTSLPPFAFIAYFLARRCSPIFFFFFFFNFASPVIYLHFSKGLHVHCFHPKLARPANSVPNIPGIPGPPVGGASSGSSSPSGYSLHSEAKLVRSCHPVVVFFLFFFFSKGRNVSCSILPAHAPSSSRVLETLPHD